MANVLSIGQSALLAAQLGISTTGHNIANAKTPGYTRQEVIQGTAGAQNTGVGFVGKGTQALAIRRIYSEFLTSQVNTAQTSMSRLDTYYTQVSQIDNMLSDSTVGLTPALQDFFNGVQDLSSDPASASTRQSLLSASEALVTRLQSQAQQLNEIRQGVNIEIESTVSQLNAHAQEVAELNDAIEKAFAGSESNAPNDLLDQRDQLIAEISAEIGVTVVKQGASYDLYIGNGQPLVVGVKTYSLAAVPSHTDPSKLEIAYQGENSSYIIAEKNLTGGTLAGLLEFRSQTLDPAQNALGRIAITLASTFNAQHQLGQDLNGDLGGEFFTIAEPLVISNSNNNKTAAGVMKATITDASALKASDYELGFDGANYVLTRTSDGKVLSSKTWEDAQAASAKEGFSFSVSSGSLATGDRFLIRPTVNGASGIGLLISDTDKIAAAAPIATSAATTNSGAGKISAGVVSSTTLLKTPTVTLTLGVDGFTGFPTGMPVTVTTVGPPPVETTYAAGVPVPYTPDATMSFGGVDVVISGALVAGDTVSLVSPISNLTVDMDPPPAVSQTTGTGGLLTGVTIADVTKLTGSDYTISITDASDADPLTFGYTITRASDGKAVYSGTSFPPSTSIDGLNFTADFLTGAAVAGDTYTVTSGDKVLTGLPAYLPVTVTSGGTSTTYASGDPVPYTEGATISYGGISYSLTGAPAYGDTFKVAANVGGTGDNRNSLLLGALQMSNLVGGTTTFQGAYSKLVNTIGNKASEMEVTSKAAASSYKQAVAAQQAQSGVNLDEEAANLLRYQQAYQAAAKVMEAASKMFDTLMAISG